MTARALLPILPLVALLPALAACASAPRPPTTLAELATSTAREPESLVLSARALEALGRPDEAFVRWLEVGRAERFRELASSRLSALIDLVDLRALDPRPSLETWLPESTPLLRKVAWRLGSPPPRTATTTTIRYRASSRLASWPGALDSPPGLVFSRMDPLATAWRETHDGLLASPRQGAGLYAFELALPPGRHRLTLSTEADLTAWVSGETTPPRLVLEHPALSRLLPTQVELELELRPGEHLELHAADRAPQVQLTLTPHPPDPLAARPTSPSPQTGDAELLALCEKTHITQDPWLLSRLELELHRRLERPRTSPRDRALTSLWHLELARLALADRTRPNDRQKIDALTHLEEALAAQPDHVEALSLLTRLTVEDDPNAARLRLEAARMSRGLSDAAESPVLVAATIETLMVSDERREAMTRAAALAARLPTSCRARALHLEAAFESLRYRAAAQPDARDPDLRIGPPPDTSCLDLRWREIALAREVFALDRARALLAPLVGPTAGSPSNPGLSPGPARGKAHTLLAELELAAGRPDAAARELGLARESGEDDTLLRELERRASSLRQTAGPTAGPTPTSSPPTLTEPLRDLRPLLLRLPRPQAQDGGATTLWRETRVHVHADGGLTILQHVAVRPLDKKAVETLGELVVPAGAEVLAARTWKKTARGLLPLEPEDILEKDTISLPALAIGDVAEWAFLTTRPPDPRIAPLWVAPAFPLDDEAGPTAEARLVVTADPDAVAPVFGAAYTTRVTTQHTEAKRRWVFSAKDIPQPYPEPLTPTPIAHRQLIHLDSGPHDSRLFAALAAELRLATRPSPAIENLVAEALASPAEAPSPSLSADEDRLRRVYEHLLDTIEEPLEADVVGPNASEASFIAHRRRGARTLALLSACRALSLRCDLALARPFWEGPPPPFADASALSYPLVVHGDTDGPGGTIWLDPSGRYNPFGTLPPGLMGVPAARLSVREPEPLAAPARPTRTPPPTAQGLGLRRARIDIALLDAQTFVAEAHESLDGAFGASWRTVLAPLTPENRQRVLSSVVQQALPGATLESLELADPTTMEDHRTALSFRWRARGKTQPAGGRMAMLGVALFPESLARSTVHLSARETPLLVNLAVGLELTVRVTAPAGHGFPSVPRDVKIEYGPLRLERLSTFENGGQTVILTKTMTLLPAIIPPSEYTAWRDAAQAVDRADLVQLLFGPGSGPGVTRPPESPP